MLDDDRSSKVIHKLFLDTLVTKIQPQSSSSSSSSSPPPNNVIIIDNVDQEQQQQQERRKRKENEPDKRSRKIRKCIEEKSDVDESTDEKIHLFVTQLLTLKKLSGAVDSESFVLKYSDTITSFMQDLEITEKAFYEVIQYVSGILYLDATNREKQELLYRTIRNYIGTARPCQGVSKVMLKCYTCGAPTMNIDLKNMLAYCGKLPCCGGGGGAKNVKSNVLQ